MILLRSFPLRVIGVLLAAGVLFGLGWAMRSASSGSSKETPAPRVDAAAPTPAPAAPLPAREREREALLREIRELRSELATLRAARPASTEVPSAHAAQNPSAAPGVPPLEGLVRFDPAHRIVEADPARDVVIPGEGKILLGRAEEIAGELRSAESRQAAFLTFENRRPEDVYVFWINFQGQPVFQCRLAAGQSTRIATFMTHSFVVTDLQGRRLGEGRAEQPGEVATISVEP